ncbi:MAG TPA: aminotransferase class V-fold PLP-dependent enzyme [Acidimicrobiales bacterium]
MSPALDEPTLARVRGEVSTTRAHFNHAGMSLTPAPVVERVVAHLRREGEVGGYEAAVEVADELAAVPEVLADLLGAGADEVAATESATRAWETVAWSLAESFDYGPEDRVVVDQFAYATVHSTLAALHRGRGVTMDVAPSHPDGTLDLDRLAATVDERTRLVVVTHMPTHLGTVTDVAAVGRLLTGSGVVFAVDVSQTLGQLPVDVAAIGCDVAFAPGRKFLRAPRGTAVLYVQAALAERLVPLTLPFGVVDPHDLTRYTLPPGLRRLDQFEYGVAARLGLADAARYAMALGLDRIGATVAARSRAVAERLGAIDGLRLTGSPDDRAIISFVHPTLAPDAVVAALAAGGVNTWVNPAGGAPFDAAARPVLPSVRVSPHYLTTDDDLDRLERGIRSLG